MDILDDIRRLGSLAATHELLAAGWTKRQLRAAVLGGTIVRVRQGWYCAPSEPQGIQRATRVGGRLACVSGAAAHELAVRRTHRLHVTVVRNGSRLRNPDDKTRRLKQFGDANTIVHWTHTLPDTDRRRASVRQVLHDMVWCQSPEWVVAAADSAIRTGKISRTQWLRDIAGCPERMRELLSRVDPKSESIIESLMRFRLSMIGIASRSQVRIAGVGRVDLLVGEHLVIELDGWEFHQSREAFEEDRRRDAVLATLGYRVLRFTYRQLTQQWPNVRAAVLACVARGDDL